MLRAKRRKATEAAPPSLRTSEAREPGAYPPGFSATSRGVPIPRDVMEDRLRATEEVYLATLSTTETIRQIKKRFGVSKPTVLRYLDRVRARREAERASQPDARDLMVQRITRKIEQAMFQKDGKGKPRPQWNFVARGEEILARVLGAFAAEKHDVTFAGAVGTGRSLLDGMSPEQLREFVQTGRLPEDAPPPPHVLEVPEVPGSPQPAPLAAEAPPSPPNGNGHGGPALPDVKPN